MKFSLFLFTLPKIVLCQMEIQRQIWQWLDLQGPHLVIMPRICDPLFFIGDLRLVQASPLPTYQLPSLLSGHYFAGHEG
ncbi:hypothetical protein BDW62DRAFT_85117 [Aspergillus aurantiobrunneus]